MTYPIQVRGDYIGSEKLTLGIHKDPNLAITEDTKTGDILLDFTTQANADEQDYLPGADIDKISKKDGKIIVLKRLVNPAGITIHDTEPTEIDFSSLSTLYDVVIKNNGLYLYERSSGISHPVDSGLNPHGYRFTGQTTSSVLKVEPSVTVSLFLKDVYMKSTRQYQANNMNRYASCIDVTAANVTLVIEGTNKLEYDSLVTVDQNFPGGCCLEKSGMTGTLLIKSIDGTNNHSLSAQGMGWHGGAISSSLYRARPWQINQVYWVCDLLGGGFSGFTIESGKIEAKGGIHSPGIGAMCRSQDQTNECCDGIYIKGGEVYAYGGTGCAGIGSGLWTPVRNIYISEGAL